MNKNSLKYLLKNLINSQITPSEYMELKKEIKSMNDETIDSALRAVWEDEVDFSPMDVGIKEYVRCNLASNASSG